MSGGKSAREIRRQAGLALNRLRFSVRLEKVNGKRKLVIHETHKRAIKWMRRGVTVVGLLSAFIVSSGSFGRVSKEDLPVAAKDLLDAIQPGVAGA